tara:strand:+ start:532 stop:1116 length:585 start_codon:yes stop_codon:yes gene_type:complete
VKKIKVADCICHSRVKTHEKIRDILLYKIDQSPGDKLSRSNSYYKDSISKLDFARGADSERRWVKEFVPHFVVTLRDIVEEMGYVGLDLANIWFQQYNEKDTHGWHIHGAHFTGVYYLEFPKGCGKTEVCSPYNMRTQTIEASEGDIIIFPSHWIHRARPNTKKRKTIISFNFDVPTNELRLNNIKRRKTLLSF